MPTTRHHHVESSKIWTVIFERSLLTALAGGETVGSTLSWLLMYLALYPEVQTICRDEIDRVVGDRNVTLDDKPNLPYVEVFETAKSVFSICHFYSGKRRRPLFPQLTTLRNYFY